MSKSSNNPGTFPQTFLSRSEFDSLCGANHTSSEIFEAVYENRGKAIKTLNKDPDTAMRIVLNTADSTDFPLTTNQVINPVSSTRVTMKTDIYTCKVKCQNGLSKTIYMFNSALPENERCTSFDEITTSYYQLSDAIKPGSNNYEYYEDQNEIITVINEKCDLISELFLNDNVINGKRDSLGKGGANFTSNTRSSSDTLNNNKSPNQHKTSKSKSKSVSDSKSISQSNAVEILGVRNILVDSISTKNELLNVYSKLKNQEGEDYEIWENLNDLGNIMVDPTLYEEAENLVLAVNTLGDKFGSNGTTIKVIMDSLAKLKSTHDTSRADHKAITTLLGLCSTSLSADISNAMINGTLTTFKEIYKYVKDCNQLNNIKDIKSLWKLELNRMKQSHVDTLRDNMDSGNNEMFPIYKLLMQSITDVKNKSKKCIDMINSTKHGANDILSSIGMEPSYIHDYYTNLYTVISINSVIHNDLRIALANHGYENEAYSFTDRVDIFEKVVTDKFKNCRKTNDMFQAITTSSTSSTLSNNSKKKKKDSNNIGGDSDKKPLATDKDVEKHLSAALKNAEINGETNINKDNVKKFRQELAKLILKHEDRKLGLICNKCRKVGVTSQNCGNCSTKTTKTDAKPATANAISVKGVFNIHYHDGGLYQLNGQQLMPTSPPFRVIFDSAYTDFLLSNCKANVDAVLASMNLSSSSQPCTTSVSGFDGSTNTATIVAKIGGGRLLLDPNSKVNLLGVTALVTILVKTDPTASVTTTADQLSVVYKGETIIRLNRAADKLFYGDFNMIIAIILHITTVGTAVAGATRSGMTFNAYDDIDNVHATPTGSSA